MPARPEFRDSILRGALHLPHLVLWPRAPHLIPLSESVISMALRELAPVSPVGSFLVSGVLDSEARQV